MAHWIYRFGDFECHRRMQVDYRGGERRECIRPAPFLQSDCYHNVIFRKIATLEKPETVRITIQGMGCVLHLAPDGTEYTVPAGKLLSLPAGKNRLLVEVANLSGLPALYAEGETFASDESWEVTWDFCSYESAATGALREEEDVPSFPPAAFGPVLRPLPLTDLSRGGLLLYDAGEETFCSLRIVTDTPSMLYYGESEEEAQDDRAYLHAMLPTGETHLPARAFRYLRFTAPPKEVQAFYEVYPKTERGSFSASDTLLDRIFQVSVHTLELCTREFFLDGIKRDRYVWSGDAYQSYLLNYYLYADNPVCRRTMLALRGKELVRHINTIPDYSFFWVLGLWDYLLYTGDRTFLRRILPRMHSLLSFCLSSTDPDGRFHARETDWVFIDWGDVEKTPILCAEQILFAAALSAADRLCRALGEASDYGTRAAALTGLIRREYWDAEKGGYIDDPQTGARHLSRQTNLLALRFGIVTEAQRPSVLALVTGDTLPPITTPYFRFYESEALCLAGQTDRVLRDVRDYWGGMLALGATSFWEEYVPTQSGARHYEMYGDPYGKSLCHAWGASPIYLFGRFVLGVTPTAEGFSSFTVAPYDAPFDYAGKVPTPYGEIAVSFRDGELTVCAPCAGGVLRFRGQEILLRPGVPCVLS